MESFNNTNNNKKSLIYINDNEILSELKQIEERNKKIVDEVICSIVYNFARNLPYSIDYMDENFVPGFFLNVCPINPTKYLFKKHGSLYYQMINWGDTLKSGILLQICSIFQNMLMGNFQNDYQVFEESFLPDDEEYKRNLLETLQMLPQYCIKINSIENLEERRKMLADVYSKILDKVGQKLDSYRKKEISVDDIMVTVHDDKGTVTCYPYRDLEMLYYFEGIKYGFDGEELIEKINKKILQK